MHARGKCEHESTGQKQQSDEWSFGLCLKEQRNGSQTIAQSTEWATQVKILMVAPWVPWRVRPRSLEILRLLSEDHEVRLLALTRSRGESSHIEEVENLASCLLIENGRIGSLLRVVRALPGSRPLQIAYADVPAMRSAIRREIGEFKPDIVHFNVARSGAWLSLSTSVPTVFDMDEIRSAYFDKLLEASGSLFWKRVSTFEARRLMAFESSVLASDAVVMVSSQIDVGTRTRSFLVPTPIDNDYWSTCSTDLSFSGRKSIVFVGRLHYRANRDAVMWFANDVLPTIDLESMSAEVIIAGESPGRDLRKLAAERIKIHDYIPDLRNLYGHARVAIVPVVAGTGVQMKLLQAMGAGVPAITTSESAGRAGVEHEREVLVADSPAAWSREITRLWNDADLWTELRKGANAFVREHYDRLVVRENLNDAYTAALIR